jgi:hypothetical protein
MYELNDQGYTAATAEDIQMLADLPKSMRSDAAGSSGTLPDRIVSERGRRKASCLARPNVSQRRQGMVAG